jgi:uncharacterized repeat protein (TIGR03803 family)
MLAGNVLFGTAASILNFTPGTPTVFRLNTDGTGFATVMVGGGAPGATFFTSQAGLVLSGSTLYGTMNGPTLSSGLGSALDQVFSVNTNGTGRTTLKRFDNSSGNDASLPGPLVFAGGTLYGASAFGGTSNRGTVFKLDTNGGGYTVLKHFNPSTDGSGPRARLAFSGQTLYGVAERDGPNNWGTLFKLDANGGNFGLVKSFDGVVIGAPAGLTLSGDTLFGTAGSGGPNANGGVYKVNTNGSGFTVLMEGGGPLDEPLVVGNTLYGNTQDGVVFKMNTDGTGFNVLCSIGTNAPLNRLALSGNTLYGIAYAGTNYPAGAIYKVNTDGTGFGVVAYLTDPRLGFSTGSRGGLLISGSTIYGATRSAIFQISTNGTGFAVIKAFGPPPDGDEPHGDLTLVGTTLYGSTAAGGETGEGTVFRLDLRPRLSIARTPSNVRLSWSSYAMDFQLEQNSTLDSGFWFNVVASVSDDGTNRAVTLPTPSGPVKYYRLRQ